MNLFSLSEGLADARGVRPNCSAAGFVCRNPRTRKSKFLSRLA
jgi:hypothetical protein